MQPLQNQPAPQPRHKLDVYLIAALLLSVAIAAFVQREALFNPLAVNDDVRNQVYWMARLSNPHLYPHDFIATYFTQNSLISPIQWLIYKVGSFFADPVRISQLLPLALAPLATYFAYRCGEDSAGKRYGFFTALSFNQVLWLGSNMAGGLARAFAYPLLFAFLFFKGRNNRTGLIATLCAASLIYPPILFLTTAIWLLDFLPSRLKPQAPETPRPGKSELMTFCVGALSGLGILLYRFVLNPVNARFGSLINSTQAAQTVEFYQDGRIPIFHFFKLPIQASGATAFFSELLARCPGISWIIPLAGILAVYGIYQRWLAPRLGPLKMPNITWRVFAASVGLYVLAWPMLFFLYMPERYLQLGLPVIYTFLLAGLLEKLAEWISKSPLKPRLIQALQLSPLVVSLAIFSLLWNENLMTPKPHTQPIFEALRHTPESTVIAATPALASDIPLYARRSVVLSQEGYIPFHDKYFQEMKTRLKGFLTAYYSTTSEPVLQFIRQYKVDYMVINSKDFSPKRTQFLERKYYHSFPKSFYQKLLKNARPQDFLFSRIKPGCAVVESATYRLIPSAAILAGKCF